MNDAKGATMKATWRHTHPVDHATQTMQIGLVVDDGFVLRLDLDVSGAKHLAESISDYLSLAHSERSSGIPSVPKSTPDDGMNVQPPDASSAAC